MAADALLQTCPFADCGRHFAAPASQHGQAVRCPGCGRTLTVLPPELLVERAAERLRLELVRQERCRVGRRAAATRRGGAAPSGDPSFVGLLENIRSLWNVGSMFRTADGAGIGRLLLAGITGCPPRPEITKTALGAEEVVPWEAAPDATAAATALRDTGYRLVALETGPDSVPIDQVDPAGRLCLVVGHEVAGISSELCAMADTRAALPMRGVKTSLNVAVAFGVAAYSLAAARTGPEPAPPDVGNARRYLELPVDDG
ncbi:MAG: TrmH family RNA methyltransferase [Candidatus Eiseniibacteriota bacterium]|jgi:tRNA G18 (ribose-2'-O)-methylase SpoU